MVFSTLHTNDAPSAVNRLLDLGVEPYLVASSLVGVLAQRLVRQICRHCKLAAPELAESMQQLTEDQHENASPCRGAGCPECRMTGYQGRIGIFEFMEIDDEVRSLIQRRCNASEIREVARKHGMKLLRENGFEKINSGQTTVEEVLRVSMQTS